MRTAIGATARIRSLLALGALTLSTLGAGCGGDGEGTTGTSPPTGSTDGTEVEAFDFGFDAAKLRVEAGTTVTWLNTGETIHTVKGRGFFSKAVDPAGSYEHRFAESGTYRYLCTLHPTTMRGMITVSR